MKTIIKYLYPVCITLGLIISTSAISQDNRPALSVPIKFLDAEVIAVPATQLLGLINESDSQPSKGEVEVVDARFSIDASALSLLAPSLQPRLFVGNDHYEVQRVEFENWDQANSKPLNSTKPVGRNHFYHFLISAKKAQETNGELPAFVTTIPPAQIIQKTGGKVTFESLRQVDEVLFTHAIPLKLSLGK